MLKRVLQRKPTKTFRLKEIGLNTLKTTFCLWLSMTMMGQTKEVLAQNQAPYKNPKLSVEERTKDLLARMTLEEKIGQMTQIATTEINSVDAKSSKEERFQPYLSAKKADSLIRKHHIGSFLAAFAVPPAQWYNFSNELQQVNMKASRLGIPIIYGNDHVHGANYVTGATIFPQPYNISNTFQPKYAAEMGRITAIETADLGQHWNFAPILDIGRNPYWPRQYETFGEDPLVVTRMGVEYIKALQTAEYSKPYKIAATAKHFLGYSDPKSGWDRMPSIIPDQELREVFLPPFKAAIEAGVKTFMVNSGELNGVPVHASRKILTDLLRKELGFRGVVVTDWADILQLIGQHRIAHNEKEATYLALMAGCDMSMTANTVNFCKVVKELVNEGTLPMAVVDTACARILRLKFELGLFENPYPRKDRFNLIGSKENKQVALEAARESIVLLKNQDNFLPLSNKVKRIVLAGPTVHSRRNLCGGWTISWMGPPESKYPETMPTFWQAMKTQFPTAEIDTIINIGEAGSALRASAEKKFGQADVIIAAVGEAPYAEGLGNISDLNLPEDQQEILKAIQRSGRPNIITMIAGRPRLMTKFDPKANAVIFAGLPCFEGATAIAEIIAGKTNPSGRLSITYPANVGHLVPYNGKKHDKVESLYPFGHGLSYSAFSYSDLKLSDTIVTQNKSIRATVKVTNNSKQEAKHSSLWFISDEVRSITPPIKELKHFEKSSFKAGETKTITFVIEPSQHLSFPDEIGNQLLEEGYFVLTIDNLKARFGVINKGGDLRKGDFNLKNYLQEEIGTE